MVCFQWDVGKRRVVNGTKVKVTDIVLTDSLWM